MTGSGQSALNGKLLRYGLRNLANTRSAEFIYDNLLIHRRRHAVIYLARVSCVSVSRHLSARARSR